MRQIGEKIVERGIAAGSPNGTAGRCGADSLRRRPAAIPVRVMKVTCSDEAPVSFHRCFARGAATPRRSRLRLRPRAISKPPPGHRRERHARLQFWIVAPASARERLGPAVIEDIFAIGMGLEIQRQQRRPACRRAPARDAPAASRYAPVAEPDASSAWNESIARERMGQGERRCGLAKRVPRRRADLARGTGQPVPRSRSRDFENRLHFDGDVARQRARAHRGARVRARVRRTPRRTGPKRR